MTERILDLMKKELSNKNLKISIAIDKALKGIPNDKISNSLIPIFFETINVLKYLNESNEMYDFYIKLLTLSLNIDEQDKIHPFLIETLKTLNIDEMTMLKNISSNNYEFISTYDYEQGKGFFNYKRTRFDYPKNLLLLPTNFDFYIDHLRDTLNLINWPIYNEQPIVEMGIQTGTIKRSRLVLTSFGEKFISCFI